MAIITINKKQFEKEVGKLTETMQNKIAMFGTPIEEINKTELQIEIFPNRPDLLCYQGFKRSFLKFLGKNPGLKQYHLKKPKKDYKIIIDSSVKNIRPYTTCSIVKGLRLNDEKIKEIIEIQEKLHLTLGRKRKKVAIGIYPLEKIKLPITYKALEPDKIKFIPLESTREMSGLEILQKHPKGKEYAHLLAGKTKFPIFLDSEKKILSMPPIINSQLTGKITNKTKEVFIECSGFDYESQKKCINILTTALADLGGEIYQIKLRGGKEKISPNLESEKRKISLENTNKLLGLNLNEKQLKQLIEKMGHNYDKGIVEIASWRTDILHEVDIIEDIAIAYGYENFTPEIPKISTIGKESRKEILKRKLSEIFSNLQIMEVSNYNLTKKQNQLKNMGINEKQEKNIIKLKGSKTDYTLLRQNLTHYLLKNFSDNSDSEYPQKIFEIGKIFELQEEIIENESMAVAIAPGNFTQIKQIFEHFKKMVQLDIQFHEAEEFPAHFIEGRVARLVFNKKTIGYLGEIHPRILRNWKIKMPVALFEINLEEIFESSN